MLAKSKNHWLTIDHGSGESTSFKLDKREYEDAIQSLEATAGKRAACRVPPYSQDCGRHLPDRLSGLAADERGQLSCFILRCSENTLCPGFSCSRVTVRPCVVHHRSSAAGSFSGSSRTC
jgi:hypothetical protein